VKNSLKRVPGQNNGDGIGCGIWTTTLTEHEQGVTAMGAKLQVFNKKVSNTKNGKNVKLQAIYN